MACSQASPCGGVLRQTVRGGDFIIEECLNGHTFRSGAPAPPHDKKQHRDVLTTAILPKLAITSRQRRDQKTVAEGRCKRCGEKREPVSTVRGVGATNTECAGCADRSRVKSGRRRALTPTQRAHHDRAMAGIKRVNKDPAGLR